MHTTHRFRRYRTGDADFLFGILHLKLKPADDASDRGPEFGTGEVLADARAWAVEEGDLGVVARGAAVAVAELVALLVRIDPALREVLVPAIPPE